jgi:hypothetical protein
MVFYPAEGPWCREKSSVVGPQSSVGESPIGRLPLTDD